MSKIGIYAGASIFSPVGSPTETSESDKWQWLEAPTAPGCLEWVEQQRQQAAEHLENLSMVEEVKIRLNELQWDISSFDSKSFKVRHKVARGRDRAEIGYLTLSARDIEGPLEAIINIASNVRAPASKKGLGVLDVLQGDISLVPWLESGGGVVIPCTESDSRRGRHHRADSGKKCWKAAEDIISMTGELIATGFAEEGKIGVLGTVSSGSLLSAVVATQQPHVFAAIVSYSPLTDMLRYHKMGNGRDLVSQFGDPDDSKVARASKTYSPYHNVEEGTEYPPWLMTGSMADGGIGPGHSRKMVARLQEVGTSEAYLVEDTDGGLDAIALMSRCIAFLMYHLSYVSCSKDA